MKQKRKPPCVQSLPLVLWPEADRTAWLNLFRPGAPAMGRNRRMKAVSRNDLQRRYSYFLDFVRKRGGFDESLPPAGHVTTNRTADYIALLKSGLKSVTAERTIHKLRRVAQLLAPQRDWEWLKDAESELAFAAVPTPKFDRIVDPHRILEAGLTLMTEAEAMPDKVAKKRACKFRNGLLIALLSLTVIRLKNYSSLELGRTLRQVGSQWWIALPATETKGGRADERRIRSLLRPSINRYLNHHRPVLGNASRHFWIGLYGKPLSYSTVARIVTETTQQTLGVQICPHLFRSCAASFVAIKAGTSPGLPSALLQHVRSETTEESYNRAQAASFTSDFARMIEKM